MLDNDSLTFNPNAEREKGKLNTVRHQNSLFHAEAEW